jgi:hypothetical protein
VVIDRIVPHGSITRSAFADVICMF